MTNYEVWYANENSKQMEKCPTCFKSKDRAQKYASTVESHGYDTVILPWNSKNKTPKKQGDFGKRTVSKSGIITKTESKTGTIYKSKLFKVKACDRCNNKAVISEFRESEDGNPVCAAYDCDHGDITVERYLLKERRAKTPGGIPKYSPSLLHRSTTKRR